MHNVLATFWHLMGELGYFGVKYLDLVTLFVAHTTHL